MAVRLELVSECDEGLDIATTSYDLDDDVEFDGEGLLLGEALCCFEVLWRGTLGGCCLCELGWVFEVGNKAGKGCRQPRIEVYVDSTVRCSDFLWLGCVQRDY